ncbi:5-(carboxyamino)imidazole ribonucleotide synthase [Pelagibacteraceae bacterium]|nr:5-(carboxyamino)imidazole ribonucleotide synthase [Candidatus Pelagibacter sp.]MDC1485303.1 5-(carboxyamino)imidazole ribonucleotide synthase [Pelagibacteraceae bacterium]
MSKPILGIIGGGQLGSMLATAAKKLKIRTIIFCDDINAPAQKYSNEFICGKYNDLKKISEFLKKVDIITFEFENIPYETLDKINKVKPVIPKPFINQVIQHRLKEKNFINKLNIKTTEYILIKNKLSINSSINLLPGLLKTTTLGYDGKGQYKIKRLSDLKSLDINFSEEFILEKLVNLKNEISVIITRFSKNNYEIYEPIENFHENQILKYSKIPANISKKNFLKSKKWATKISEALDYIGTLCVEFFIDNNDKLYVNEVAPRVHNSGHLTINSHNISQFENHIRAVCGLKKVVTKKLFNAKMINLIGSDISIYRKKKFKKKEFFYDYFKDEIKKKRKMGHVTTIFKK